MGVLYDKTRLSLTGEKRMKKVLVLLLLLTVLAIALCRVTNGYFTPVIALVGVLCAEFSTLDLVSAGTLSLRVLIYHESAHSSIDSCSGFVNEW